MTPRARSEPSTQIRVSMPVADLVRRVALALGAAEGTYVSQGDAVGRALELLEAQLAKQGTRVPPPAKAKGSRTGR